MPDSAAEEALTALARDLVEEISAGRALELASDTGALELAVAHVKPFPRLQRTKTGKLIPEHVRGHDELRSDLQQAEHFAKGEPGHLIHDTSQAAWLKGQQQWAQKGVALWGAGGTHLHDIDPPSAAQFGQHTEAAHAHLSDPDKPALAKGYEALHNAHRVATEQLLPRAETDQQKQTVRDSISHVQSRMKEIDKASGVKSTRTGRLTGAVPERAARAAEALAEPAHPMVQAQAPKLPPPPTGAAAVHPHLGLRHVTPLAGDTMAQSAHRHVPQPLPQEAPSPEGVALGQANTRLAGYVKREENQRQSDLRDHLAELRQAESEMKASAAAAKGMAAPGEYAPLTEAQYQQHARDVEEMVNAELVAGRSTADQYSTDGGYSWSPGRALVHDEILQAFLARQVNVPSEKKAVLLGGLSGAGKSTTLKKVPGVHQGDYAVINPDDFKKELGRRGLVPEVAGLSPMEAGALVHDESSHLADQAGRLLVEHGKNVAYDVTMANESVTRRRLDSLKRSGYTVTAVFVDVPVEKSVQRALARHRKGLERYRQGTDPLGGRYVPPDFIRGQEAAPGVTKNRQVFDQLKPQFASWQLWDNSGTAPRLAEQSALAPSHGIPSIEALLKQQAYTGSTEAQARAAETGALAKEET